jgi:hypothetical protein
MRTALACPNCCRSSVEGSRLPTSSELADLVMSGVREVGMDPVPFTLGRDEPLASLRVLRFLRDARGNGLTVRWHGSIGEGLTWPELSHLDASAEAPLAARSRSAVQRMMYWRSGPGFVQVRDCRSGNDIRQITFGDKTLVDVFRSVQEPTDSAEFDERQRAALEFLVGHRLVLTLGRFALGLPYRIGRWPVPAFHH